MGTATNLQNKNRWTTAALLLSVTLPLYLAFQSISLDDFDSYSFALALRQFSLDLHQPQPPGFPVYIFIGRITLALCSEPLAALTLLSAISGAASTLCIFGLAQLGGARKPLHGVGAAVLFGLTPISWLTADKALSDGPGLALTLLSLWAVWKGRDDLRWFYIGCFISGLGMGIRPQNFLPVVLLLAGLLARHLWIRRSIHLAGSAAAASLAGVLIWLIPTLLSVGGPSAYLDHIATHSMHVGETDSLFAGGTVTELALRGRLIAFTDTFLLHTVGLGVYSPWGADQIYRAVLVAAVVLPGIIKAGWRDKETWLLTVWLALVSGQVFLLEILDRPRLMLPILPPLVLLIARGWSRIRTPRPLASLVLTATGFALLLYGTPLAAQLATVPAPPVQAAYHITDRYAPGETLIVAAGSFRAAQVEMPEYRLLYLYEFDAAAARSTMSEMQPEYVAILDRDQFETEAIAALNDDGRYVPLEDLVFSRDPRIHTQHDQVRLQILTPAESLPAEALMPPPGGCIDIGSPEDGRYILEGWFRSEEIGGVNARWAGTIATSTLRINIEPEQAYELTLRALAYPADQRLIVRLAGQPVAELSLPQTWSEHTVSIPPHTQPPDEVLTVELVHAHLSSPYTESGGESSDQRLLAAAYDLICLTPEQ